MSEYLNKLITDVIAESKLHDFISNRTYYDIETDNYRIELKFNATSCLATSSILMASDNENLIKDMIRLELRRTEEVLFKLLLKIDIRQNDFMGIHIAIDNRMPEGIMIMHPATYYKLIDFRDMYDTKF